MYGMECHTDCQSDCVGIFMVDEEDPKRLIKSWLSVSTALSTKEIPTPLKLQSA